MSYVSLCKDTVPGVCCLVLRIHSIVPPGLWTQVPWGGGCIVSPMAAYSDSLENSYWASSCRVWPLWGPQGSSLPPKNDRFTLGAFHRVSHRPKGWSFQKLLKRSGTLEVWHFPPPWVHSYLPFPGFSPQPSCSPQHVVPWARGCSLG